MILYQIHNHNNTACSGTIPLPRIPDPGDVAEAVGWDHSRLYEQGGQWVTAEEMHPTSAVRYGVRLFVGRVGSGEGYWVWAVQSGPGRYVAVAAQRVRSQRHKWVPAGHLGHAGIVPAAPRTLVTINGQRLRWPDGRGGS